MKTIVYVDGFNLYYGAVKGTPYKWLDLGKLFKFMLPEDDVTQIRYFTARVKPTPANPEVDIRQQAYLRALRTIPNLSIQFGSFQSNERWLPKVPIGNPVELVQVLKTEEKGSDVNLASMLLLDCFDDNCEQAVIVSADSDLAFPISAARERFSKRVGLLFPTTHDSAYLRRVADYYRRIALGALQVCQFPDTLYDRQGTVHRPEEWETGGTS